MPRCSPKAPKLRCLITFSVGLDHIDLPAVKRIGIPLARTPNVLTDATADLAWALILGASRRLKPAMRSLENGEWRDSIRWASWGRSSRARRSGFSASERSAGCRRARESVRDGGHLYEPAKADTVFLAERVTKDVFLKRSDVISITRL